jgi:hypothetical protein
MRLSERTDYKNEVHPSLLGFAAIYSELVRMSSELNKLTPAERERVLRETDFDDRGVDERLQELVQEAGKREAPTTIDPFYVMTVTALERRPLKVGEIEVSFGAFPDDNPNNLRLLSMMEFLAEQRFGRPLYQLVAEDRAGVKESSVKMQRIIHDGHKLRYGERIVPIKGKLDHRIIFSFGLGLGLEKLTAEKLASFFDDFCPTCSSEHDPDSLRRQRDDIQMQRTAAIEWGAG